MITRPTISIPVITFLPSVAASSPARSVCSSASIGATLAQPQSVSLVGARDRLVAGPDTRGTFERPRVVVEPERCAARVERTLAEQRSGRRPDGRVAAYLLRVQVGADRDQLREVVDR